MTTPLAALLLAATRRSLDHAIDAFVPRLSPLPRTTGDGARV